MAAPMESVFDSWLSKKLTNINSDVDLEVFVSYITGILDTDISNEDKNESIAGILGEITEELLDTHCEEIINKWMSVQEESQIVGDDDTVDDAIQKILSQQQAQVQKSSASNDKAPATTKAAILAQYSQISDGEDGGDDHGCLEFSSNMNASAVENQEKKQRDQLKLDHENKKLKDKEDKEKQKQKAVDRKEKEKKRTQKGERRR